MGGDSLWKVISHNARPDCNNCYNPVFQPELVCSESREHTKSFPQCAFISEIFFCSQIELGLPENLNFSGQDLDAVSPVRSKERHTQSKLGKENKCGADIADDRSGLDSCDEINEVLMKSEVGQDKCRSNLNILLFQDKDNQQLNDKLKHSIVNEVVKDDEVNLFEDSYPYDLLLCQINEKEMRGNRSRSYQPPLNEEMQCTKYADNSEDISTQQKHSTPLQNICGPSHEENDIFKTSVNEMSFCSIYDEETSKKAEAENLSDILMESITSQMEGSLRIFEDEQTPDKKEPPSEDLFPPMSEDLFPSNHESTPKSCLEIDINSLSSSNDVFETSPDHHAGTGNTRTKSQNDVKSVIPRRQKIQDESHDQFELDFKKFQDIKHSFKSVQFQGAIIKIKIVDSLGFIPIEEFKSNQLIGIGIKLSTPKRIGSLSRHRIGSKILVGRSLSHTVQRPSHSGRRILEGETYNSIAIFDSVEGIIWLFQWTHKQVESDCSEIKAKVGRIFRRIQTTGANIVLLDAKERFKKLFKFCGKLFPIPSIYPDEGKSTSVWDPKIADWLMYGDEQAKTLDEMVSTYLDDEEKNIKTLQWPTEALESYWGCKLMSIFKEKLKSANLWKHFTDVEMACMYPLILMEMNGFGLNSSELENLKKYLDYKSVILEVKAYQLAGRQFNLSSPKEIRQILFREIGLKEPEVIGTAKDVLVKLDHELPHLIIEWRKVVNAIKTVIHFLHDRNLDTGRVHGCYSQFTLSGRVIMAEPSLQCIPRDFDLKISYNIDEIKNIRDVCRIRFSSKLSGLLTKIEKGSDILHEVEGGYDGRINISMRNAFIPCSSSFVLLSADYSQLELRILAHLCEDKNLVNVLNQVDVDAFKNVAAEWKNVNESEVTIEMRQKAKAIIYGIIYGMGSKALADQMEIGQEEASAYISDFMRAYPKVRTFIDKTIRFCRENGYVETISGRKRTLKNITSRNSSERAQAERQAVNYRIQGSASDLVKTAMIRIYFSLAKLFPGTMDLVDWSGPASRNKLPDLGLDTQIVCFPILNLHDELIFEVKESHLAEIARDIKFHMEGCMKLNVRLPVVVRTGKTWGTLSSYSIS